MPTLEPLVCGIEPMDTFEPIVCGLPPVEYADQVFDSIHTCPPITSFVLICYALIIFIGAFILYMGKTAPVSSTAPRPRRKIFKSEVRSWRPNRTYIPGWYWGEMRPDNQIPTFRGDIMWSRPELERSGPNIGESKPMEPPVTLDGPTKKLPIRL